MQKQTYKIGDKTVTREQFRNILKKRKWVSGFLSLVCGLACFALAVATIYAIIALIAATWAVSGSLFLTILGAVVIVNGVGIIGSFLVAGAFTGAKLGMELALSAHKALIDDGPDGSPRKAFGDSLRQGWQRSRDRVVDAVQTVRPASTTP